MFVEITLTNLDRDDVLKLQNSTTDESMVSILVSGTWVGVKIKDL